MEVLFPRSRGKRIRERSQSLPARLNSVLPGNLTGETAKLPKNEPPEYGSEPQNHTGETQPVTREEIYSQPLSFDDWAHLQPDERGAELAREARVWKVYVGETDKWDKELVEGWDKSMDVLLVFAALFSAISAAFLIESSGMLKHDPNDLSAAALLVISRALVTLATSNSSASLPPLSLPEQSDGSDFVPSKVAVIINTLWYLSLSLSIATAFLAMLAKDWCYSFSSHRTGHPRDQAHRRQRKWKLIERWKMEELVLLLPSLMHLSLLLFAVGLCLYLWDLNHTTAIPVMCVASAFLLFYIWSSITASLVEDFPYTTILSRILRSKYMQNLDDVINGFGFTTLLLLTLLFSGFAILYFVFAGIVILMVYGAYYLFLQLDRYTLQRFAKTPDDVTKRCNSAGDASFDLAITLIDSPLQLCSMIRSWVGGKIKSLELTEDLTTSLALSWIIQHCETPSAVDIALQAIAGASQGIPKPPLLSCQATEQIIRRIVSHSTDDKEKPTNDLYTRGLAFLGLKSGLNPIDGKQRTAGEIEVMVWDLKSKNESIIAKLIQDGSFIPTDDNLEAMRIGNSAASQSLRFLRGEATTSIKNLYSISQLLSRHFESEGKQLHPAAVQSLANAAALYLSLSTSPELPPDLMRLCMRYCIQLIREQSGDGTTESVYKFGAGVVFIICVLLNIHPNGGDSLDTPQPVSQLSTRALHSIRALIKVNMEGTSFQESIFWIGCSEIVFKPSEYGLDEETDYWRSVEGWCSQRASNFMLECGDPFIPKWHGNYKTSKLNHNEFLTSISLVHELVSVSRLRGSMPTQLPESIHTILMMIACDSSLDSPHRQVCDELVSKFSFPALSKALVTSLELPTNDDNQTVISAIGACYTKSQQAQGRRHFAATQLWLLLNLADDSSSPDDQLILKENIKHELEDSLPVQSKGFYEAKIELENFIIKGYRKEPRVNEEMANDKGESLSFWERIKARVPGSSQQSLLHLGSGFNRFASALQTGDEDSPKGKHQRAYTARIIERILEAGEMQGDSDLLDLIKTDLEGTASHLREPLSRLPPLRAASRYPAQTGAKSGPEKAVDLYANGPEYVSLDVRDMPASEASDAEDNYSDCGSDTPFNDQSKS